MEDASLKAKELQRRIKDKHKVEVPYKRVYAGKELAHAQLFGSWDNSFSNLYNIRPGAMGLRTWRTYFRIKGWDMPAPNTSCNCSYRSRTNRNRRKLPESYSDRIPKLVSG
jgi:hypothetical protein